MIFVRRENLSILDFDEIEVPLSVITDLLKKRKTNIIYFEKKGYLYGIVTSGDIYRGRSEKKDYICIRTDFVRLDIKNPIYALRVFFDNSRICNLPCVNNSGQLIGEYERWNSMIVDYDSYLFKCNGFLKDTMKLWGRVFLAETSRKHEIKEQKISELKSVMQKYDIDVNSLSIDDKCYDLQDMILVYDEEEARGIELFHKHLLGDSINNFFAVSMLSKLFLLNSVQSILQEIEDKGVKIITLTCKDNGSNYYKNLETNIKEKYKKIGKDRICKLFPEWWREFYRELYNQEYAEENACIDYQIENGKGLSILKDWRSQYYNVVLNKRVTTDQPENYKNRVLFFGPSIMVGQFVEDRYTIESCLQRILKENGSEVMVENYGCWSSIPSEVHRLLISDVTQGDIIVIYIDNNSFEGIPNINLMDVLMINRIGAKDIVDNGLHGNHIVNKMYAEAIYERISCWLYKNIDKGYNKVDVGIDLLLKAYKRRYFKGIDFMMIDCVGAIVMNCNPFTNGHKYLIENAVKQVNLLIVFVVEEDKSLFPFEMRMEFARRATQTYENIIVVPSGEYMISRTSFPEYFVKCEDEDIQSNMEYDVVFFATEIAGLFNIKKRFVGDEPEDDITRMYNETMKKILPLYGIELVEIERKRIGERIISGTAARKSIEDMNNDLIHDLLPDSTIEILNMEL